MNRHEKIMSLDKLPDNVDKKKIDEIFDDYYKKIAKEREKTMSYYKKDDKVLALLTVKDVDWSPSNTDLPYKLRTKDGSDVWISEDEIVAKYNSFTDGDEDEWENPVSYVEMLYMQGLFSQVHLAINNVDEMKRQAITNSRDTECGNPKNWKRIVDKLKLAQEMLLEVGESITSEQDMGYEVVEDED